MLRAMAGYLKTSRSRCQEMRLFAVSSGCHDPMAALFTMKDMKSMKIGTGRFALALFPSWPSCSSWYPIRLMLPRKLPTQNSEVPEMSSDPYFLLSNRRSQQNYFHLI